MSIKVDLHTHSAASPDGALTVADYQRILKEGRLDCIAVTDHNTIDFARKLQADLGAQIIIGEEISTGDGEIIGLYLSRAVPAGLSAMQAATAVRSQGGLVYIPHPFETVRSGISLVTLNRIAQLVDIIEVHNGRAVFQNRGAIARQWAADHHVASAASSDAHGQSGWGRTYSVLSVQPSRETLPQLLQTAELQTGYVGVRGILYPKLNRMRRKLKMGN